MYINDDINKSAIKVVEKDYYKAKTSIKEQELNQEIKYLYNKILKKLEKYK